MNACQHGYTETAMVLLDYGAKVDYKNEVRWLSISMVPYTNWSCTATEWPISSKSCKLCW